MSGDLNMPQTFVGDELISRRKEQKGNRGVILPSLIYFWSINSLNVVSGVQCSY